MRVAGARLCCCLAARTLGRASTQRQRQTCASCLRWSAGRSHASAGQRAAAAAALGPRLRWHTTTAPPLLRPLVVRALAVCVRLLQRPYARPITKGPQNSVAIHLVVAEIRTAANKTGGQKVTIAGQDQANRGQFAGQLSLLGSGSNQLNGTNSKCSLVRPENKRKN